jgi:diaminopimelate epimerase
MIERRKMKIPFTKMHGIGNDYVYIDLFRHSLDGVDIPDLARKMSPRHFSVGSDGVILICPSDVADARMRMFNADGSEGKMCGNGVRCVAKYCYDTGIAKKEHITVETLSGIKTIRVHQENGCVKTAVVDMGKANLTPAEIPVKAETNHLTLHAAGRDYTLTAVSMGNPHAVTFVDSVDFDISVPGRELENHPAFPERANIEFVKVIDRTHLQMRVWERGSGETYACGTGACATAVAAVLAGHSDYDTPITVRLLGGDLTITVGRDLSVQMEGAAETVYEGVYTYEN